MDPGAIYDFLSDIFVIRVSHKLSVVSERGEQTQPTAVCLQFIHLQS